MGLKKILIGLVILLPFFSFAQEFKGGVLAGFVTSQVDGDSWSGYNKSSFSVGAFVNRQLTKKVATQMELRYIRKGASHLNADGLLEYRSRLNYAEIPFLAQYLFNNFYFEGGVSVGVLINTSLESNGYEIPENQIPDFNRLEIGALGGFSYQVLENLRINFRLEYSILPILENVDESISTVYEYQRYSYNNVLSFSVYYFL